MVTKEEDNQLLNQIFCETHEALMKTKNGSVIKTYNDSIISDKFDSKQQQQTKSAQRVPRNLNRDLILKTFTQERNSVSPEMYINEP